MIYTATGSHRYEVTFTGRGGHSFQNFGIPNPIHAMGRAIAQIAEFQVPDEPKTTFNVGVIQGGTSVNTISGSASMLVDLRSDSEEELNRLDEELHKVIELAVEEENARWDVSKPQIKVQIEGRGVRPAGGTAKGLCDRESSIPGGRTAGGLNRSIGMRVVQMRISRSVWESRQSLLEEVEKKTESIPFRNGTSQKKHGLDHREICF